VFEDEHVTGQAPRGADEPTAEPEPQHVPESWRGKGRHVEDWEAYGQERVEARDELGLDVAWGTAEIMFPELALPAEAVADLSVQKQEAVLDPETGEVLGAAVREPWSLTYTYGGNDPEALKAAHQAQRLEDLATNGPGVVRGPTGNAKIGGGSRAKGRKAKQTTTAPRPDSTKVKGRTDAGAVIKNPPPATSATSRIKESRLLQREAKRAGRSDQTGIDRLTEELQRGNLNPGIGTKPIGQGISEARARSGARVYFRQASDGSIEILGKSTKGNQDRVIREVLRVFGR
jgi:putative component of toxin-antitoxin plasmid stabilization module